MKAACVGLLVVAAVTALGQKPTRTSTEDKHFRWSERQAHELDDGHTIAKDTALAQTVRRSLLAALLVDLARIDEDDSEQELRKLAENTRIELTDLNGDGKPEIIAQGGGLGACSGSGGCYLWIFAQTFGGVRCLFDSTKFDGVFENFIVRPWSTRGYRDIVISSVSSAAARDLEWLKFDGRHYRRSACYYLSWMGDHGEELKSPDISWEDCGRVYSRKPTR